MRTGFQISSLVPSGLVFDGVSDSMDSLILAVRSEAAEARCPLCATASSRIHSRYVRHVADLPSAGRKVRLRLLTRRFTCEVPHCYSATIWMGSARQSGWRVGVAAR